MRPLAEIPSRMPRSGIREIMDLAWKLEQEGPVIHLEVGQPDFETPAHIVEATCRYARQGHTKYVPNAGIPELRSEIARRFEERSGVPTSGEQILVTPGAVMSMATAFLAILEAGDEVLLPDPSWPNYRMALSLARGVPVYYRLIPNSGFLPDPAEVEARITSRTKLLVLCSPSNPTGQVFGPGLVQELMALARRHDLYVLSDEIYEDIVFDQPHASALACDPDERTLIISGFSKSYAMTGYRIGYTRARPEYIAVAAKIQEPLVSCGTGFSQWAAVEALRGPQDCVGQMCAAYKRRRDIALQVLRENGLYRYTPGGAFYLLVDVSAARMDSRDFAIRLLNEHRVAVAPGSGFGEVSRDHVRISIASSDQNVREGLSRLCALLRQIGSAPR